MKSLTNLLAVVCGVFFLTIPLNGYAINTLCIQSKEITCLIRLDMPHKEIIETLGTPDFVKSEGMCLQYEYLGVSLFLNRNDRVEQIYLSGKFLGYIGDRQPLKGIQLSDIEKEFGARLSVEKCNYRPSPLIQNRAATETENQTDPSGRKNEALPLQYPGSKKLYIFYHDGKIVKYKYVLDEEGIAFWLDSNQQLYATVLYPLRDQNERAAMDSSLTSNGKKSEAETTSLAVVHFDLNMYQIRKMDIPILDRNAAYLNDHPSPPVVVEGHTDDSGSNTYNQELSERRANAVREFLIQKGIASSRIQTAGFGKHRPLANNQTAEGRAMNRRAEVEIIQVK